MLDWVATNKDWLAIVLSSFAFLVSLATLTRTVVRDKKIDLNERLAKLPRITVVADAAHQGGIWLSSEVRRPDGWDYRISIEVHNRSEFCCELIRIDGSYANGPVLFSRPSEPMKTTDDFRSLVIDRRSHRFRLIDPGATQRIYCHLFIDAPVAPAAVQEGLKIKLEFSTKTHGHESKLSETKLEAKLPCEVCLKRKWPEVRDSAGQV